MVLEDPTKRELLKCLSNGLWHTTSELARRAHAVNPVVGLVTVGTILTGMQQQLGEGLLETMVQSREEGVTSWRIGVDWLDRVNHVLKKSHTIQSAPASEKTSKAP
jgi:hypothetical protein